MPTPTEADLRRQIVEIGQRVYDRFLVAANDGNISARLDDKAALVTPTGVSKGFMSTQDMVKVSLGGPDEEIPRQTVVTAQRLVTETDVLAVPFGGRLNFPQGALVTPLAWQIAMERHVTLEEMSAEPAPSLKVLAASQGRRPSSETPMHLAIYHARADVRAIVHTHAPAATAFAVTDVRLDESLLPEVLVDLGPVALVPYARGGGEDLPLAMAPYLTDHDAFLLANHGAVTVGGTLEEAYFRTERLELFARIQLAANTLGPTRALSREEVLQLVALWEQARRRA
jgi:ribulose-5-phosphate 4-epimerase/fuculose-1-phosphate aldolase